MSKGYILIVEDDIDIGNMLKIYFSGMGYDVDIAVRGGDELDKVKYRTPDVIIQDIMLPDIDGFLICRNLRENYLTARIPLLFLTQKDEQSDAYLGMEVGADAYMSKPFDIYELKFQVETLIRRNHLLRSAESISGLPSGALIANHLQSLLDKHEDWAILDISIMYIEPFREVYGISAADDVIRFTAALLKEEISNGGSFVEDFIGHIRDHRFIVSTTNRKALHLKAQLKLRFEQEILAQYTFADRMQGYLVLERTGEKYPFMKLAIGITRSIEKSFTNIHEMVCSASEARRLDTNA